MPATLGISVSIPAGAWAAINVGGVIIEPDMDLNFATGTYMVDGAPVAIGAVVGEDQANLGPFNPATHITPGEGINGGNPLVIGDALTPILTGNALVMFDITLGDVADSCTISLLDLPNFNGEWLATVAADGAAEGGSVSTKIQAADGAGNPLDIQPVPGAHLAAIKFKSDGSISWSVDGSAVETAAGPTAWADTDPNSLYMQINGATARVARIRIYNGPIDDADLPELSAG